MTQMSVHEAGAQLYRLIQQVRAGEEIVLTLDNEPVARLTPIPPLPDRQPGGARDLVLHVADDFDAPLPDLADYSE